jgi:hypothetical protein
MQMEWKEFDPVFFAPNPTAAAKDLSLMSTFGWKEQARLEEQGIGFVHKGGSRYMVASKEAAREIIDSVW